MEGIFPNNQSQAEVAALLHEITRISGPSWLTTPPSLEWGPSSRVQESSQRRPSYPWSRWKKKKVAAGEKTHTLTVFPDRFLVAAIKHFCLYLTGQILVTSPYLAAREAGKYYCLYSRWPNADSESEVLVLRRKGSMGPQWFV